ncbi:MAG: hypothetical protein QM683_06070 [Lacrimispora sp.]
MNEKKLYAVYDNGELLGEYDSFKITELLQIPCREISSFANSGSLYNKRYTFKEVDMLAREWDRVRLEILAAGR